MQHQALALVQPSNDLRDTYRALIAEFVANGNALVPFTLGFDNTDFDAFLSKLADCANGVGVPDGFVAHSTFWLVRDGTEVVGVSNIRHALTPALLREGGSLGYGIRPTARRQGLGTAILRLSLLRAAALGVPRVLVTCGKQNVASAGAILRNGGVLESEEYLADRGEIVQRYWITQQPVAGQRL
jgi:predicted acetyltransferase